MYAILPCSASVFHAISSFFVCLFFILFYCGKKSYHELCPLNKSSSAQYSVVDYNSLLYSRSLGLIHLAKLKLQAYLSVTSLFPSLQPLETTIPLSVSMSLTILDTAYKWNYVVFVLL